MMTEDEEVKYIQNKTDSYCNQLICDVEALGLTTNRHNTIICGIPTFSIIRILDSQLKGGAPKEQVAEFYSLIIDLLSNRHRMLIKDIVEGNKE